MRVFCFLIYLKKKKVHPSEHLKLSGLHWVVKDSPQNNSPLQNYGVKNSFLKKADCHSISDPNSTQYLLSKRPGKTPRNLKRSLLQSKDQTQRPALWAHPAFLKNLGTDISSRTLAYLNRLHGAVGRLRLGTMLGIR